MATMMAPEEWTDKRLDDLNARVDEGFNEMREEFRAIRTEIREEIGSVRGEIGSVRGEIGSLRSEVRGEIAALHRTMLQLFGGMWATFVIGIIAILLHT